MNFFDEVQQEAQIAQISLFFYKYLKIIIVIICLILVLFTGYYFLQQHNDNLTIAAANEYDKAVGSDGENRFKLLQIIVDSNKNNIFKVIAQLKLAEIAVRNRDFNKAAHYYKNTFKNNKAPKEHADYAELMLIKIDILSKRSKDLKNMDLLENYINSNKIFIDLARLYLGSIYIDNGYKKEAQNQFNYLLTNQLSDNSGYIIPIAKELMGKTQTN